MVKVDKKRFTTIKNNVKRVSNKNSSRGGRSCIYVNDSNGLIQSIEHDGITHNEALEKMFKIRNDIKKIVSPETLNTS